MDLSIIIPLYNTPTELIQECLESIHRSVISQKYEIIIVNDGSNDEKTVAFITDYNEEHTRFINKKNAGVSSARNVGLELSTGKYILFLDSDDLLLPQINHAIQFLQDNQDYDLVYCDTIYFGDQKYYYKKGSFSKFKLLYMGNFLNVTTLIRSSIAKKYLFDEHLDYAEDYDYWCRIADKGHKFKYLPKPFFMYRRILNGISLSQITSEKKNNLVKVVKNKYDVNKEITLESVNEYIVNNFKDNKSLLFKLILIIYFPVIFKFLKKNKIFKNHYLSD